MSHKKWILLPLAAIAGLIAVVLILWGICVVCSYLEYPPSNTAKAPGHQYAYDLSRNGTINTVLIDARYTFYSINDVRYLETDGNELEVKFWGTYAVPEVRFDKNGDVLAVYIRLECSIDNDFGSPKSAVYVYLPLNWSYRITSSNEHGDTYVENKSWNYETYGEHKL